MHPVSQEQLRASEKKGPDRLPVVWQLRTGSSWGLGEPCGELSQDCAWFSSYRLRTNARFLTTFVSHSSQELFLDKNIK